MDRVRQQLALSLLPGIRAASWRRLALWSPAFLLSESPQQLRDAGVPQGFIKARAQLDWDRVDQILAWMAADGAGLCFLGDPDYPWLLAESPWPPVRLFYKGDKALWDRPQLAVVGTRKPTPAGRNALALLEPLLAAGLALTSGLALGIDGLAHQQALQQGAPTLAVLASGLERCYPRRHQTLFEQIAQQGLLLSEMPPGTATLPALFPQRNRIIAGLSLATLVVEASLASGSLITARLAAEAGREVLAVPGSPFNPQAQGCHQLLKEGAGLATTPDDLLFALKGWSSPGPVTKDMQQGLPEHPVLDTVGDDTTPLDLILERSNLAVDVVLSYLLELEIQGYVCRVPGGYVRQRRQSHV
ncbi:DNA-processing protein DprA [Gallaecimonas xiamenensis]|uniref:DNA protecting protein DprA n=1 Tax=Gallaecimonas xiamenensis 3-C-1 TaxID=745411 RepID=K2JSF0_9GAMM|nr:DNA-processing protein DprA [Gallaecimonas xiamenensis]EKE68055.1 DNA protecting protein DprA [Gallaecimonas xiamenensis 3-C-1]